MASELLRMCGVDLSKLNEGHFLLIREGLHHDATFALAQFISVTVSNEGTVLLVSLNQAKNHYVNVLAKFGVRVKDLEQSKQFSFIDGLKYLSDFVMFSDKKMDNKCYEECLKQFYLGLKTSLSELSSKGPTLLVVDDLLLLETLGFNERMITNFFTYLKSLSEANKGTFLSKVHSESKAKTSNPLMNQLCHCADVVVDVDQLSSGYCSEIDGEVITTIQDLSATNQPIKEKMHYRILPSGQVKYIAPGMSKVVL